MPRQRAITGMQCGHADPDAGRDPLGVRNGRPSSQIHQHNPPLPQRAERSFAPAPYATPTDDAPGTTDESVRLEKSRVNTQDPRRSRPACAGAAPEGRLPRNHMQPDVTAAATSPRVEARLPPDCPMSSRNRQVVREDDSGLDRDSKGPTRSVDNLKTSPQCGNRTTPGPSRALGARPLRLLGNSRADSFRSHAAEGTGISRALPIASPFR